MIVGVTLAFILATSACSSLDEDDITVIASPREVMTPIDTAASASVIASAARSDQVALEQGMSWNWQLQGELDDTVQADLYDIDLFDNSASQIASLKQQGRIVICYFSAGSYEEWRDDAADFSPAAIGKTLDGWEDERWLNVRDASTRAIMAARLDLAAAKGCDGVEPDNVTAKNNDTGFEISPDEQVDYNRFLADAAHDRGLLIGLKNNQDQIADLIEWFDFAVNEECHQYEECGDYQAFIDAGKPVFNAEYADQFVSDPALACGPAEELGLSTLILSLELDNSLRISCPAVS